MTVLVVLPGQVGPPRRLVDVLRERHEGLRERYLMERAYRESTGATFGEDVDIEEERKRLAAMSDALAAGDLDAVRIGHVAGLAQLSALPTDPGPFTSPPDLDDVYVQYRHTKATTTQGLRKAWAEACADGDPDSIAAREMDIVTASIASVTAPGVDGPVTLKPEFYDALRDAGIFPWVLTAALHMQRLTSGKAWRSGVLPPKT